MLKLGYKELFLDLDSDYQYPIEALSDVVSNLVDHSHNSICLDFTGIDQLTDEVFLVFKQKLIASQKASIEKIDLTGCCHLTDRGIEILAQTFPNLKEICLVGCIKLTQLSLIHLNQYCNKLTKVKAAFTAISYLPKKIQDRWGTEDIKCNPHFFENDKEEDLPLDVIILSLEPNFKFDIGKYLTTGKMELRTSSDPIVVTPNAWSLENIKINIVELYCPTEYMTPFIHEKSLFIIAMDSTTANFNTFNVIRGLDFIRGTLYCCPVQVLAVCDSADTKDVVSLSNMLKNIFTDQEVNMKEHLDQEHYSKSVDKSFIDQVRYVQSLSSVDQEHISLHVTGVNSNDPNCNMCFCCTICEPSTEGRMKQIDESYFQIFKNVKDSVERINKADISEIRSMSKVPEDYEKVVEAATEILKKKMSFKEFIRDNHLLNPFLDFDELVNDPEPERSIEILQNIFETPDKLEKVVNYREMTDSLFSYHGKLFKAIGLWLSVKWSYCEEILPLKIKARHFEDGAKERMEKKTSYELLLCNLRQDLRQLTTYMYSHYPSKYTSAMRLVLNSLQKINEPIMYITNELLNDLKHEFTYTDLMLVLHQLSVVGKVYLSGSSRTDMIVITNCNDKELFFVNNLNTLLLKWTGPINGNRIWSISSDTIVATKSELKELLSFPEEQTFFKFIKAMISWGIILTLGLSWVSKAQHWEPMSSIDRLDTYMYISGHQLPQKPFTISNLIINNRDEKSDLSVNKYVLKEIFPDVNSDTFDKNELSFKFSFKFRTGIPSTLFSQIISYVARNFRVSLVWKYGIVIRDGAVEIMILHNTHASRGSSSFEVESRIKDAVGKRRPVAVREHMWSALSDVLTIIEGCILRFPHLHHKLRHYCRGQCMRNLKQETTFSSVEVGRSMMPRYMCSKCHGTMNITDWLLIIGRQYILPNHDVDEINKNSCKSCWKRDYFIDCIWQHQLKVYPVFARLFFKSSNDDKSSCIQGNVIGASSKRSETIYSDVRCGPKQFSRATFHVIDTKDVLIRFIIKNSEDGEVNLLTWNLGDGKIKTKLEMLKDNLSTESTDTESKRHNNDVLSVKEGNIINLAFVSSSDHPYEYSELVISSEKPLTTMSYKIDNEKFSNPIYMAIDVKKVSKDTEDSAKLIVTSINASKITANYFRPGMILLMKKEIRWEPSVVYSIVRGKLSCIPLEYVNRNLDQISVNDARTISIDSDLILPPAIYPSDINSTLDSKNNKALSDDWMRIFADYSNFIPASFSLFPKLHTQLKYEPLIMFGIPDNRQCTSSIFTSSRLLKTIYSGRSFNSRVLTSYIPLPHPMTPENLLIPHRNKINGFDSHALHRLCSGIKWSNFLKDYHPMNEPPEVLSEEEAKFLFNGYLSADVFALILTFGTHFMASYQYINECFPLLDPDIDKDLLRDAILSLSKTYRDIYLFDAASKIELYDSPVIQAEKNFPNKKFKEKNRKFVMKRRDSTNQITKVVGDAAQENTKQGMERVEDLFMSKSEPCVTHRLVQNILKEPDLGPYCQCLVNIALKNVGMEDIDKSALATCTRLQRLEIKEFQLEDTKWLSLLPSLTCLTLDNGNLTTLGEELLQLKYSLRQFSLCCQPLKELPDFLCDFTNLTKLNLDNTLLTKLPDNFGNLTSLKSLSICHTLLDRLPDSFVKLKKLYALKMSGIPSPNFLEKDSTKGFTLTQWNFYTKKYSANGYIYKTEEGQNLMKDFLADEHILKPSDFPKFRLFHFESFPRFKEFPVQIFGCTALETLVLSNQAFTNVPDEIGKLKQLTKFSLDGNLNLETLSGHLGYCPLEVLALANCSNLKTPSVEIRAKGMRNTIAYLLRLVSGSEEFYRTKLMLVGLGGAGKTSLKRALMNPHYLAPHLAEEAITDGIDIAVWTANESTDKPPIEFSVWDFAGQTLYYNTHQFFITTRAIYLLIWNVRQGFEHAGLEFWLNSIRCHAPDSPIFVVGTHSDKVEKSEIPIGVLSARYPSIIGFHFISSLNGMGVKDLHDQIMKVTRSQPYMGEIVPNIWLRFEKALFSQRTKVDYLTWDEVKQIAINNAIYDGEINRVIRFLHDLGSIQYFETPLLKDYVIINSQWLVDVMACVVSVKNSIIKDGKLHHSDVKQVWKKYPTKIHSWLLKLTEIFDLTFSIPGKDFNYVPCLLPNDYPPGFDWPQYINDTDQIRESNMIYEFEYLPPGLFNRVQVRLSHYSDSVMIWQDGSLLLKNEEKAFMQKTDEKTVKICARGCWPDNILFIVHEVFETLIIDAFSGVSYEYKLACAKCVAEKETDPYFFTKSVLLKASKSKTAFMQCHKHFHIIPMKILQESMPPDSLEDYDLQFRRSVQFIASNQNLNYSAVMVIVAYDDFHRTVTEGLFNTSKRLVKDLQKLYSVNCEPVVESAPPDDYIGTITQSHVIVVIVSKAFIENKLCSSLFKIAKDTLRKNMCFVVIDTQFKTESLGMEIAETVYINFIRSDVYDEKFKALQIQIDGYCGDESYKNVSNDTPRVFISYCWENSLRAYKMGNSKYLKEDAIGWGDPRDIKDYLEQNGISCWLDVEQIQNTLYSDITEGLKKSEVILACLSTEYTNSETCRKEFMFAKNQLHLPVIVAEVGKDDQWKNTELGLLSIECDRVSFQNEDKEAFDKMFQLVNNTLSNLPKTASKTESSASEEEVKRRKKLASQEDLELIQRKIYRLLTSGFNSEEFRFYPNIFCVDVVMDDVSDTDMTTIPEHGYDAEYLEETNYLPPFTLYFRVLCENESGWHPVDEGIPLQLGFNEMTRFLTLAAPYLYRITLLLKLSNSDINLFKPNTDPRIPEYFMSTLEKNAKSWNFVKSIHHELRSYIIEADNNHSCGCLKNCCMNNGRLIWLCQDHRDFPHISVLGNEESDSLRNLNGSTKRVASARGNNSRITATNDEAEEDIDNIIEENNNGDLFGDPNLEDLQSPANALINRLEDIHLKLSIESDSISFTLPAVNDTNNITALAEESSALKYNKPLSRSISKPSQNTDQQVGSNSTMNRKNQQNVSNTLKIAKPNSEIVPALQFSTSKIINTTTEICQMM